MIPSNPYSKSDPYGARADYEYDMIQEARHQAHLEGECIPGICDWCEDKRKKEREDNNGND